MSEVTQQEQLIKHSRHSHYWIEDECLYESYETLRGRRWRQLKVVPGMPDEDKCSEACLIYIQKEYYS